MTSYIQQGTVAPQFEAENHQGRRVRLEDYGNDKLVLCFFRFSACAVCNLRVQQMIRRWPDWERQGLKVLAVFESPKEAMNQYVGRQQAPFPLISDPEGRLYDLYHVEVSEEKVQRSIQDPQAKIIAGVAASEGFPLTKEEGSNFYRMPAEFLIGPGLIVQEAHYSGLVFDHMPLEAIDEFARK